MEFRPEAEVSRCPLNLTAWQLVSAAVGIRTLSRLSASGSNVGGWLYDGRARDGPSLQALDLSHNKLEYVMELVAGVFVNLAGNPPLTFSHGLLSTAQREGVRVDLTGVDFREARAEAQGLLESGAVRKTDQLAMVDKLKGFSCFNLKDGFLQANPELFLPRELCGCLPGWGGSPGILFDIPFSILFGYCQTRPRNAIQVGGKSDHQGMVSTAAPVATGSWILQDVQLVTSFSDMTCRSCRSFCKVKSS